MNAMLDRALAACPKGHFLSLEGSPSNLLSLTWSASYVYFDGETRTHAFSHNAATPEKALSGLIAKALGTMEVAA